MTTSRVILLFLAIIFLVALVLSGNRFAPGFKERFLSIFPAGQKAAQNITPTPTKSAFGTVAKATVTPHPSSGSQTGAVTKGGIAQTTTPPQATKNDQTPATGPAETTFLLLGGSFVVGYLLRQYRA